MTTEPDATMTNEDTGAAVEDARNKVLLDWRICAESKHDHWEDICAIAAGDLLDAYAAAIRADERVQILRRSRGNTTT